MEEPTKPDGRTVGPRRRSIGRYSVLLSVVMVCIAIICLIGAMKIVNNQF